jgi:hypothetical protein
MRYATVISFLFIFCFSRVFFSGSNVNKIEETVSSNLDVSAKFAVQKEYTVDTFSQRKLLRSVRQ